MDDGNVICLHGLLGSPESWAPVASALRERGFSVTLPALPGHGPAPRHLDASTFDAVVERLGAEVLGRRSVVLGYSLGGRLALALAAKHPDRVRAVLAIGASTGIDSDDERASRLAWEAGLIDDLRARGLLAFVDAWQALPLFATQATLPPDLLAAQRQTRLAHDPEGIAWALSVLGAGAMPPLLPRLAASAVPKLFAVGAHDERALAVARRAMGMLPRAEVAVIPGAGHNLLLEASSTMVELAIDFVTQHLRAPAMAEVPR